MDNYKMFFPHEDYRPKQKKTIKKINSVIPQNYHVTLSAPNGSGKSSIGLTSTLPLVYNSNKKLVYLCRTLQQNDRVIRELKKIKLKLKTNSTRNLDINGIALRGRGNMCINEELLKESPSMKELMQLCQKERITKSGCKYFQMFKIDDNNYDVYDEGMYHLEINPELERLIYQYKDKVINTNILIGFCKEKDICPYYFIKALLKHMKVIVCNYNWIFNPFIRNFALLKDLNVSLDDIILVVDECHNLPEHILEINEEKLSLNTVRHCNSLMEDYSRSSSNYTDYRKFQRFVNVIHGYLKNIKKNLEKNETDELIYDEDDQFPSMKSLDFEHDLNTFLNKSRIFNLQEFKQMLTNSIDFIDDIHRTEEVEQEKRVRNWLGNFVNFWEMWIQKTERKDLIENYYAGYNGRDLRKNNSLYLHIKPIYPVEFIKPVLDHVFSSIHMSGTLNHNIYKDLTGLVNSEKNTEISLKMYFDKRNRLAIIDLDTTTHSDYRNEDMFRVINQKIREILKARPGNTGIFVVSYKYFNFLNSEIPEKKNRLDFIIEEECNRKLFKEIPGARNEENADLIKDFKSTPNSVLLGVLGGKNSEGEDFPGKEMETVIIVGFPFAYKSPYINKKIDFFDKNYNYNGWEYAYLDPAVIKANQAAGRPIRDKKDKGVIIFLDWRYRKYFHRFSAWLREKGVLKLSGKDHPSISYWINNFQKPSENNKTLKMREFF